MKRMGTRSLKGASLGLCLGLFTIIITFIFLFFIQTEAPSAFADEKQNAAGSKTNTALTTSSDDTANLAGKWEKWPSGWYFKKKSGDYATGLFSPKGDSRWYYANSKGLMKTGWVKVKGTWYFANSNGAMASGWKKLNGYWYYLDPKTKAHPALTGFFSDGKARYYTDKTSCAMKTGWIKDSGKWYYANLRGALQEGWLKYNAAWYYLDPAQANHPALTGLFEADGGVEYCANKEAALIQSGWAKISSKEERYAGPSGALLDFYAKRNEGDLRIFNGKGKQLEGWQKLGNEWFYLNPEDDGKAVSGKFTIDGRQYYFGEDFVWHKGGDMKQLLAAVDKASARWYTSVKGTNSIPQWLINRIDRDMLALWNSGADVGYMLVDINSGATIAGNASKYFYSASTIKGPYVCALSQHWPSKAKNWKGTIKPTISYSSNEGYASLRQAFGSGVMKTYMKEAKVTHLSSSAYYQNMRPRDLAKLWVRNYEYFTNGNSTRNWLWPYLVHTSHSFMDAELGKTYWVYSKPGWMWGSSQVYNDAGIVYNDKNPYVLAVMSSGASGVHDSKLKKLVRDLHRAQEYIH